MTVLALAWAASSCGTLAAQSAGDVDLPTSLLGPFRALSLDEVPFGSSVLVRAVGSDHADEPSVITLDGRRVAYVSLTRADGRRGIGRSSERRTPAARSMTEWETATAMMEAELPWENGAVSAPGAYLAAPGQIVLVYQGGAALGLAMSADGQTFMRGGSPILTADAAQGEAGPLEAPSIARAPTGEWFLAYASAGSIFAARAPAPMGPWARIDGDPSTPSRDPILAPQTMAAPDAGAGFEMRALGDPALSIEQTTTGRAFYRLYYTGQGMDPHSSVGAAASYDAGCSGATRERPCFARVGQPVYLDRTASLRAGSFEALDDRTGLLWVGTASGGQRVITAGLAPVTTHLGDPTTQ